MLEHRRRPAVMPGHVFNSILSAAQRRDPAAARGSFFLFGRFLWYLRAALTLALALRALDVSSDTDDPAFVTSWRGWRSHVARPAFLAGFVNRADASKLWTLGGWFLCRQSCTLLIEQTDRIVVGAWPTVDDVTHHWRALAQATCWSSASRPRCCRRWGRLAATLVAREDREGPASCCMDVALRRGDRDSTCLRCWPGAGLVPRVDGSGLCRTTTRLCRCSWVIRRHCITRWVAHAILAAMHRVRQVVQLYSLPQAILNAVLSIALVSRLGVVGVALGTMLPAWLLQYSSRRIR